MVFWCCAWMTTIGINTEKLRLWETWIQCLTDFLCESGYYESRALDYTSFWIVNQTALNMKLFHVISHLWSRKEALHALSLFIYETRDLRFKVSLSWLSVRLVFKSVYRLNMVKYQILTQKKMMNWICFSADVVFSHAVCHLRDGQRHDGQQQSGTNAFLSESPAGSVWRWIHTISDLSPTTLWLDAQCSTYNSIQCNATQYQN